MRLEWLIGHRRISCNNHKCTLIKHMMLFLLLEITVPSIQFNLRGSATPSQMPKSNPTRSLLNGQIYYGNRRPTDTVRIVILREDWTVPNLVSTRLTQQQATSLRAALLEIFFLRLWRGGAAGKKRKGGRREKERTKGRLVGKSWKMRCPIIAFFYTLPRMTIRTGSVGLRFP